MSNNNTDSRIASLREAMAKAGVAAVIIPQCDPHQSEYLAEHWKVRGWLSGFTGSAGALVVTADKAYIWADSRYWLQSRQQLAGTCVGVMEEGRPEVPSITDWLVATLSPGLTVGVDGMVISASAADELRADLGRHGLALNDNFDVIDRLWTDRPALPDDKTFIHPEKYAGASARAKINSVLDNARAQGADSVFVSDLAEIAWMLNIRSRDVESNPVATSYLYIAPSGEATLFIDPVKLTAEVLDYLTVNGVTTAHYVEAAGFVASLPADARVAINPAQTSARIAALLGDRAVRCASPVALLKACKNDVQIAGVHQAMIRDGVALVGAVMELEKDLADGRTVTELDVVDLLTRHRSARELYFDNSFGTIAGFGPHGAIVHYEPTAESNATITEGSLLLIDSGAQYLDGTTDITRTIAIGTPTADQRHDFTLVLKGHIALGTAIFPEGTRGDQLDALARMPLWKEGLSYLHGTGHGVGHFLNVHEGPQSIRLNHVNVALAPGMIISNEPGLYREGAYGIRCENLVEVVDAFTTDFGRFYRFETLTLFPFDRKLIDTSLLSGAEIDWINTYHAMVYARLESHLGDEAREWLRERTSPIA